MSFTDIEVVLLSPVLFLATRGKGIGVSMDKEMMPCSDEDVAVEMQSVMTNVMNNLARDGIVGSGINSNISPEGNNCRHLVYLSPL